MPPQETTPSGSWLEDVDGSSTLPAHANLLLGLQRRANLKHAVNGLANSLA
jgi:hypothetical protein